MAPFRFGALFCVGSAAALLGGCGTGRATSGRASQVGGVSVIPASHNFVLESYEVVQTQDQDGIGSIHVFIDDQLRGKTSSAYRSSRALWSGAVAGGNRLVRLERWLLPRVGEWVAAPSAEQPPERFILIKSGERVRALLKVSDEGRRQALEISREPLVLEGAPRQ